MCVQETWLKPKLEYEVHGYTVIRKDKSHGGGGDYVIFVKQNILYRLLEKGVMRNTYP